MALRQKKTAIWSWCNTFMPRLLEEIIAVGARKIQFDFGITDCLTRSFISMAAMELAMNTSDF